ncbi:MAG: TonB-dependent receptor [Pseudomonadota bacterium]|nr:TonB-dependent receptor [Pseudomonadota bacterium]
MSLRRQSPRSNLLTGLYSAVLITVLSLGQVAIAQNEPLENSTVVFEAEFFKQFQPVSVNDMISRIPGSGLALGRGGGGGRRGLGGGGNEILINGQRITGKSNGSRDQLRRIAASQVRYIEIIRGTSEEIDVRGGSQVINIVLIESASRSSLAAEINADLIQDGTVAPGGRFSYTGQNGQFNYLFAVESEPRYRANDTFEASRGPAGRLLEIREETIIRDQNDLQASMNLGYQFENSIVQFNALIGQTSPPTSVSRTITDFRGDTKDQRKVREGNQFDRDNWEIGADYEYDFSSGATYRVLFLVNDTESDFVRERFDVLDAGDDKDLFLRSLGRDRERILRTSYTWDVIPEQALELGVEGAQTIRNNGLLVGSRFGSSMPSAATGNLPAAPLDNAFSEIEEVRYEYFGIHNWQLNERMALESQLIFEDSTITQAGDVNNARSFSFLRPRVDYRFDITPTIQLRATIEKEVSQLSFSDFSLSQDNSDDDQNVQGGNPDVVQEQTWRYDVNFEYRLPEGLGVINTQLYYRDIDDVIGRIDVSASEENLLSARGNIGAGKRYGISVEASSKLTPLGLPNALATLRIGAGDSSVVDPFLLRKRRMRYPGRWSTRASFRHDYQPWNFSYGFNYSWSDQQGLQRVNFDLFDTERDSEEYSLSFFLEKRAFNGVTFRFDIQNANNKENCRLRTRYDGRITSGIIEEIENYCRTEGVRYAFRVRHTF